MEWTHNNDILSKFDEQMLNLSMPSMGTIGDFYTMARTKDDKWIIAKNNHAIWTNLTKEEAFDILNQLVEMGSGKFYEEVE